MPSFKAGDVVRVPFPYTNRGTTQHRPALVVSDGAIGSGMLLWTLMITSESNRPWLGDVVIDGHAAAGLPVPSVVRTLKIATIESSMATPAGSVSAPVLAAVRDQLRLHAGLTRS